MENASKALIMAAEVLIGVMILSIGVYLFSHFADYSKQNYQKIEEVKIAEFNNKFLKFYAERTIDDTKLPVASTIHDIVGLANFANKNNLQYEVQDNDKGEPNSLYVQIDVDGIGKNLEKKSNDDFVKYIQQNSLTDTNEIKYYKCVQCLIDEGETGTKRVYYVEFKEFTKQEYRLIRQMESN